MQFKAKDGSSHSSQLKAFQHGAPSAASQDDGSQPDPTQQPQGDIESNPDAMQCVDTLKQMGYTAEDVAKAMKDDGGGSQGMSQIPGM